MINIVEVKTGTGEIDTPPPEIQTGNNPKDKWGIFSEKADNLVAVGSEPAAVE
jgi:hypothetical protein